MNHDSLRPNYDPNLLPQWQGPSKIEVEFVKLEQSLYEQETNSLLCGSAYKEADDKLLSAQKQVFLNAANPFMLRYRFPHEPVFCHNDNLDCFSEMKKDLVDPLESTNPEQAVSLSWDIDCLARNPYEALRSWQCAFNNYLRLTENSAAILPRKTYCAFHVSTLYLLCLFVAHTCNDSAFNPMQISSYLETSFLAASQAFLTILDVYPPVKQNEKVSFYDSSEVAIYDYMKDQKSVWHTPSGFFECAKRPLCEIFEKHIKKNGFISNKEWIDALVTYIIELCTENGKMYYLMPFICTKGFAQLFFKNASESSVDDSLESYETLERLFNDHQRKIQDDAIYCADENKHPVIAFMLDMVSLCYSVEMMGFNKLKDGDAKNEKSNYKRPEHEIMNQINTNWFILYLYGKKRLFNNPCICSQFCELRLPIFLKTLFGNDEEPDGLRLSTSWLFSLAHIDEKHNLTIKEFDKFSTDCKQELEKMSLLSPAWNKQLAEYIFNPSMWENNSLKASSIEFQTQIDGINALINEAHTLLGKHREADTTPSILVRGTYIVHLFEPILEDIGCYLETLASLEMYWTLFVQLAQHRFPIKEHIDSLYEKAT